MAVRELTIAHPIMQPPMYHEGRTRVMIMLLGIWPRMYPTKRMEMEVLYCVLDRPSSSSKPLSRARVMALRSRKFSQYISHNMGYNSRLVQVEERTKVGLYASRKLTMIQISSFLTSFF